MTTNSLVKTVLAVGFCGESITLARQLVLNENGKIKLISIYDS